MRHIGSLLVAAVFAPSIFLLTGTGLSAFNSALDDNKVYDPLGALAAVGALLLAGILYAILVMARLSPLGPTLAGLAAIGMSGWALFDIGGYRELFSQLSIHMGGSVGETGLGILLGVPLFATVFSGRRWRREALEVAPQPVYSRVPAPSSEPQTWVLPAAPVYQSSGPSFQPLPDVAPPSLRYPPIPPARPVSSPPAAPPVVSAPPAPPAPPAAPPVVSAPPAAKEDPAPVILVPPSEAPPLPRRIPSPPPQQSKPDDDVTEQLSAATQPAPSDDETNKLS